MKFLKNALILYGNLIIPLLFFFFYSFGRPGVEFYGQHASESGEIAVTKIIALPNEVNT